MHHHALALGTVGKLGLQGVLLMLRQHLDRSLRNAVSRGHQRRGNVEIVCLHQHADTALRQTVQCFCGAAVGPVADEEHAEQLARHR